MKRYTRHQIEFFAAVIEELANDATEAYHHHAHETYTHSGWWARENDAPVTDFEVSNHPVSSKDVTDFKMDGREG